MRNAHLVAWISVHSSSKRKWSNTDLQILDDVSERTWGAAERGRTEEALRAKEERFRQGCGFHQAWRNVLFDPCQKNIQIARIGHTHFHLRDPNRNLADGPAAVEPAQAAWH